MSKDRSMCPICAWRADCKKKFNPGAGLNCADFSRDVTVKVEEDEPTKENAEQKKPKKGLWPM